ncbi:MAG: hypothetical protein F4Y39_24830 [Gemmatimonadetes bacterium]|nr:hypothetical protein [Gemmatimonadota bacterium]
MPIETQSITVTPTPKNIVSGAGLISGDSYYISNEGGVEVRIASRQNAPDLSGRVGHHKIRPNGGVIGVTVEAGYGVWVWTPFSTGEIDISDWG